MLYPVELAFARRRQTVVALTHRHTRTRSNDKSLLPVVGRASRRCRAETVNALSATACVHTYGTRAVPVCMVDTAALA